MCGCYPATAPASELLASNPDGVFLSNGPGDPAALGYAVENARELVKSEVPVFGICLGHQLLSLALGGSTYKLKFGHRGAQSSGQGTGDRQSRDHVAEPRLRGRPRVAAEGRARSRTSISTTARSRVSGTRRSRSSACSTIPRPRPGPHDADYLFRQFLDVMEERG